MGGSFESGAGDNPDDLFGNPLEHSEADDEPEDESSDQGEENGPALETESEADGATSSAVDPPEREPAPSEPDSTSGSDQDTGSDRSGSTDRAFEGAAIGDDPNERKESSEQLADGSEEHETSLNAARLARSFVPASYEKPHAWALGRDGVNDGRTAKKTFFLQTQVLDLEAACSSEVNELLGGSVPLTDLRELALIFAYHHPEQLAEAAREWGSESA